MGRSKRWAVLFFSLSLGGLALAQGDEPLSPFAPPTVKKPEVVEKKTAASPLDSVEFRGVIEIGGVAWVSVYDPKSKKSYRLTKDELGEDGFSLVKYDTGKTPGEEKIVIRQEGMTKELSLKDADIISLKELPRPAPQRAAQEVQPQNPTQIRVPQPKSGNPNMEAASDEEVRERMQRVAEEIRRRRALRSNIINDGNQGKK